MPTSAAKLPMWPTIARAYGSLFENPGLFARAGGAWMAVAYAAQFASGLFAVRFAGTIVHFLALTAFAVVWHRGILLGERPQGLVHLRFGREEVRYFLLGLLLTAAILAPAIAVQQWAVAVAPHASGLAAVAIKLEDGGPVFITQDRVGQDNELIRMYKFRTMYRNEVNLAADASDNTVTKVGKILRITRLDELPQLWNVLRGDLSFIRPRPELPSGVALYEKEIPYYGVRHLIKPGLSGWAQLYHDNHPHHGAEVEATREKLSYDLYYLKHRSLLLDVIIILKTVKKLLTRSGV